MRTDIFGNIRKIIKQKTGIDISYISQFDIPTHIERQMRYLCEDKNKNKKYLLVIAYTEIQKHNLEKTIKNITRASQEWKKYFLFNMPLFHAEEPKSKVSFILYDYFEDAVKEEKTSTAFEDFLTQTYYKENTYKVHLTTERITQILDGIVEARCPLDELTRERFRSSEGFRNLRKILNSYDEMEMALSHGDAKSDNILNRGKDRYLIGFEYGRNELPLGFDLYAAKKMRCCEDIKNIPYQEFQETLFKIHHVPNWTPWLRFHNPKVRVDKKESIIKVLEEGKFTNLLIKKTYPWYDKDLYINFDNAKISPLAVSKIAEFINQQYDNSYIIRFKNCPYYIKRLKQDKKNVLSFSGVINKDVPEEKNLLDRLKQTQAYRNYSRILPFVKPYWFRAILSLAICIPIGSLDAVIALSLKPYMDLVMVDKSIASPWYIPFVIVLFTSIQGFLNYSAIYLNTWVGNKITNDLKFALYKKMLTLDTSYFSARKSGDIVMRFNTDAEIACAGLLENLKVFVSRLFSSISLVCVLFYNSWQLAFIASFILICAFLPLAKIRERVEKVMNESIIAMSAIFSAYNETYAGNKTITSYNLEKHQEKKFKNILDNIFNLRVKIVQRTSWLSPVMHIIVSVGIGLAIGYGSFLILSKQITSGNFVSFITALIMLYTPIKNIGNNFNAVQFSFLAIERIFTILDSKPYIKDKENAKVLTNVEKGIKFNGVCFEYVKNRPVLKNITFEVKKGETVALVGNSGGGKSTIVNLLPRFYDVKAGGITIDGLSIKDYTLKSLRQSIAIVFQDNFLFAGTIKENIMLGNEHASEEQLQQAIEFAYLGDFIKELKDGINTEIGERGILLSGGQKQRVAIARAFLKDAPVVVLDEATSALDNKSEAVVQKAIDNLMKKKTVIVIAHRLSTIQNADRIVVINNGQIVEQGTHDELLKHENGAYKSLYNMQFAKK